MSQLQINAVLDGEVVVLNEQGSPDFQKLQHWAEKPAYPLLYYVFDLLKLNGKACYELPLIERKKLLRQLLPQNDIVKYSDHIVEQGEAFFEVAKQKDLEGIMAKKLDSKYYPGKRSADWLKIKHNKTDEAVIVGFTKPRGGRKHFGALVLGVVRDGMLFYAGHTGSGFSTKQLKDLHTMLVPHITETSPFAEKVTTNMPVTWVKPLFICEVKFTQWTTDGRLRHPIFLRIRNDKTIDDINMSKEDTPAGNDVDNAIEAVQTTQEKKKKPGGKTKRTEKAQNNNNADTDKQSRKRGTSAKEKIVEVGRIKVKTTNRTKVFFPDDGITKGDVIDYYEQMADVILPHLKDRPQSLYRTPNGIRQKGFFQKDAGEEAPSWVKHILLPSGSSAKKEIDYILCNNKASLLYMANLGCIEINPWHSRTKHLDNPDYLIIDIDPSEHNTFDQVIEAANVVKEILDDAGATGICKTSGASGLHVYVPLGAKYTYDQAKDFANIICLIATTRLPESTTLERSLKKRSSHKIYMDYLQNRRGQTIASVYSLRPKKGATVSTPLLWSEVQPGLTPQQFTIATIPERIKKMGDLFEPILHKKNAIDLLKCIERLGG